MALSSQNKVKRLMGQVVGVAAGTTVVVATAAAVSISLTAQFLDVTVFEDRAFYQLEVIEEVIISDSGEAPEIIETETDIVRLRVQNQWDDISIPLTYGYNEGFIDPLRANQDYTLTIEVQRPVGWATLDTYFFNTTPTTVATISDVSFNTTPNNPFMDLSLTILTQQGVNPALGFYGTLESNDDIQTFDLIEGLQTITLSDLVHRNETITINVYASSSEAPQLLFTRSIQTPEYVESFLDLSFPNLTTLNLEPSLDTMAFEGMAYGVRLLDQDAIVYASPLINNSFIQIDNLLANRVYTLEWFFTYTTSTGTKEVLVETREVTPIEMPLFVLDIQTVEQSQELTLTIDKDLNYESIVLTYTSSTLTSSYSFDLSISGPVTDLYTLTIPFLFESSSTLTLTMTQPAPDDYPIVLKTIIFQGGN
jgi:hypothetical protein